jgi:hypothetical protein
MVIFNNIPIYEPPKFSIAKVISGTTKSDGLPLKGAKFQITRKFDGYDNSEVPIANLFSDASGAVVFTDDDFFAQLVLYKSYKIIYTISETASAPGYQRMSGSISITVNPDGTISEVDTGAIELERAYYDNANSHHLRLVIANYPNPPIPFFEEPPTPSPSEPVTPDEPESPDEPDDPESPESPDVPENPETPESPESPDEPETPVGPHNPDEPHDPGTPPTPETRMPPGMDHDNPPTGDGGLLIWALLCGAATITALVTAIVSLRRAHRGRTR